jgi:two-component system phosphate regulon response regulator PhoB
LVILDGRILHLSSTEYVLLALLVWHAGEAVPRTNLLTLTRKVDMHIKGLRRKLGAYADQYLETVFGVGYLFRPVPGA